MDEIKHVIDAGAVGTAFATLVGWLPHISSLLAIVWLLIRIYESKTVQRIVHPKRHRNRRLEDQSQEGKEDEE